MGDCLRVGRDPIMLLRREMYVLAPKARQDPLHQCQTLVGCSMVDQGLSSSSASTLRAEMARTKGCPFGSTLGP